MRSWTTSKGTLHRGVLLLPCQQSVALLYLLTQVCAGPGLSLRLELRGLRLSLFLTHAHYDHAHCASRVQAELGARVIINKRGWLPDRGKSPLPRGTNPLTRLIVVLVSRWTCLCTGMILLPLTSFLISSTSLAASWARLLSTGAQHFVPAHGSTRPGRN